jgi:hypothetical protein
MQSAAELETRPVALDSGWSEWRPSAGGVAAKKTAGGSTMVSMARNKDDAPPRTRAWWLSIGVQRSGSSGCLLDLISSTLES